MDKYMDKVLCACCRSVQSYSVLTEKKKRIWNGIECTYNRRYAVCDKCGNRVSVPGMDDLNETEFDNKCREEHDYILIDEINDILIRYDVEKRPLSLALGMGEHTIENYLKGQLPNKHYSDMLKRVLTNYRYMQELYSSNKDRINNHAAKKIESKLEFYNRINSHSSMIESVALYVLNSKYEITNLSLQKLLYYVEAFCQVLLQEKIYSNRCEAWTYGPVYPDIYEKYKTFGKEQILVDPVDLSKDIDEKYRKVIDYVLNLFAIYNGVTLKDFSHAEDPWKNAHAGYGEKEHCQEIITHEAITDYFTKINSKYDLSKEAGVKKYISSLGVI